MAKILKLPSFTHLPIHFNHLSIIHITPPLISLTLMKITNNEWMHLLTTIPSKCHSHLSLGLCIGDCIDLFSSLCLYPCSILYFLTHIFPSLISSSVMLANNKWFPHRHNCLTLLTTISLIYHTLPSLAHV